MRIWAKLIVEGKNVKDTVITYFEDLTYELYETMLRDVAYALDIPTPLALKAHYKHFRHFHIEKLKVKDFVEDIDFDRLELEECE